MRKNLLPLMLADFFDFAGLFMMVPIITPLIMQFHFLGEHASYSMKTLIIGILVAAFGLGQFLGGPILGDLSDQYGRKKVLIITFIGTACAYVLGAIGLITHSLSLLLLCRLAAGFCSGTGAILFASASDLGRDDAEKGRNIAYLTGAIELGLIAGALLGAQLSNSQWVPWFGPAVPFFFFAAGFIVNVLCLTFYYFEQTQTLAPRRSLHILMGFQNMQLAFQNPRFRGILLAYLLFCISTEACFISVPIYAVQHFGASSTWIGNALALQSLCAAFGVFVVGKYVSKVLKPRPFFLFGNTLLILLFLSLFIPRTLTGLYIPFALLGVVMTISWAQILALISQRASVTEQGKIMGITQSLLSTAIIAGPFSVGLLAGVHYDVALAVSPVAALLCLSIFYIGTDGPRQS